MEYCIADDCNFVTLNNKTNYCMKHYGHIRKHGRILKISHPTINPAYSSWIAMKSRCTNPKTKDYIYYGARGIKVCDRWLHSFPNFLEDMGEKPKNMTIDRINNNCNYEPGNCKWSTMKEQALNKRPRGTVKPL
jgi:hypothetical protein